MYSVKTSNGKSVVVTDNHLFPTLRGDVRADALRTDDYILFNTMALDAVPEKDTGLAYDQGFLIGMYLGDGSIDSHGPCQATVNFSLNERKYGQCISRMNAALADSGIESEPAATISPSTFPTPCAKPVDTSASTASASAPNAAVKTWTTPRGSLAISSWSPALPPSARPRRRSATTPKEWRETNREAHRCQPG